uniref:Uncharacterized protein n=1 Tax=Anopheles stephensi TaxID=30069 RepID=A0A182YNF9_ANOST
MRFRLSDSLVALITLFAALVLSCKVGHFPQQLCCCTMRYKPHNKTIQMEHRWECGTLPSEWEELEAAAEPVASDVNIPFASLGAFNDTAERWEKYANLDY